jgi:D-alanyl-D-alanine carboxypeptidase
MTPTARKLVAAATALVIVAVLAGCAGDDREVAASPSATEEPTPTPAAEPSQLPAPTQSPQAPAPAPAPTASVDDPASLSVVVNKLRPLQPLDYVPADLVDVPVQHTNAPQLRKEAADAVVAMFAAFEAQTGLQMQSTSAYRAYTTQVDVYAGWVRDLGGAAAADLTSARAGFSEHQTGLALDIGSVPNVCPFEACFADTPQGQWLAANSWTYGFVLRFPNGGTPVTGYEFEPWHYRYVGVATATDFHTQGATTLEEYFGLPAAPTYAAG